MKLITKKIEASLPKFYAQENKGYDAIAYVKFFTPDSNWTWYVLEYNRKERLCFGYVKGLENEFGYFSIDELEAVRGPLGLHIERDLYFEPVAIREVMKG